MPDAQNAIITSLIVFILALLGIAILGALPPVEGPLSDEAAQFRVEMGDVFAIMAALLGGCIIVYCS